MNKLNIRNKNKRSHQVEIGERTDASSIEVALADLITHSKLYVPISIIVVSLLICYFAHGKVATRFWLIWEILFIGATIARFRVLKRLRDNQEITAKQKISLAVIISFLSSCVHASTLLFFPYFSLIERSIQTLLLVGMTSASISVGGGYRPLFVSYAGPILTMLSIAWAITPFPENNVQTQFTIIGLILCSFWAEFKSAQNRYELFEDSFNIREEQKGLNSKLNSALNDALYASESKTRFLASASHDLRQPIHTLSLLSAALSMRPLDTKTEKIATHMDSAISTLATQMDALLDISKLDAGLVERNMSTLNLSLFLELMEADYSPICLNEKLELIVINDHESPYIRTDSDLLERIVRNLISNAVKYTDSGSVTLKIQQHKNNWKLIIQDSGKGISKDELKKVFDEFYQVENPERDRKQGLGLGLAIVKRLTKLLKIKLEFESELGTGTTVSLSFPMVKNGKAEPKKVTKNVDISNKTILCIDDEQGVRDALDILLTGIGCNVEMATGTTQAVDIAKKNKPDIVLADFRLKGEDTGLIAIEKLRDIYPGLPALLVTGDTSPNRLNQANSAGIRVLHKPVSSELLAKEINLLD